MAKTLWYPKANRTAQNFSGNYPGAPIDADKLVWHTTETGGWPGYGGDGRSAPHLTYNPATRQWRQHYPANRSARALVNRSGGVETNTDHCLQVEIIAYSDEALARERGHLPVSKLSQANLADLADFARWALAEWGIPLTVDGGWVRSNYRNPTRMTFTQWRAFTGQTGHNRVPENTHWDPAALDIDTIVDPTNPEDDMLTEAEAAQLKRTWELTTANTQTLAAILAKVSGDQVDEAALAVSLAPLLIPHLPGVAVDLDDEDLARIAAAVADEQSRRLSA